MTHRAIQVLLVSLLSAACSAADAVPNCALCAKAIPEGQGVVAELGAEDQRSYRCIHCALTDLEQVTADVSLRALTPLDGDPVRLTRSAGSWSSEPPGTVFLILPERADECLDVHQPFADLAEFERYLAAHPEIAAEGPQAYTIDRYEEILAAGLPESDDG